MGLHPSIVVLAYSLLIGRGFCSTEHEPKGCDASPDTCKREVDVISHLQANIAVNNKMADVDNEVAFRQFVGEFGRTYVPGSAEHAERLTLFSQRKAAVEAQNSMADRTWTAAINEHSDRRHTELQHLFGRVRPRRNYAAASAGIALRQDVNSSQALDAECTKWNDLKAVKQIQNQGGCGSCWAVAAATALEAHAEIAGKHRTFSAQELVECVENPYNCGGSGGCSGATAELAFDYVTKNSVATKEDAPYTANDNLCFKPNRKREESLDVMNTPGVHTASLSDPSRSFGMVGWERLPENKYEPLLRAVSQHGPVGISVVGSGFFGYHSGIFNGCSDFVINHAVVLIGYGEEYGRTYWLIQNSWGPFWGENGKMRLLRTDVDELKCGMDNNPQVGTGCDGGESSVWVCGPCGILYDSAYPRFEA